MQSALVEDRAIEDSVDRIISLDLTGVKERLSARATGACWARNVVNEVELEYRRFLILNAIYPNKRIAPSPMVDEFWHQHIIDTAKYAEDCNVCLGYFLHHQPCGSGGEEIEMLAAEATEETLELYKKHFPDGDLTYWVGKSPDANTAPSTTVPVPSECYSTPAPHGG